MNQMFRIDHSHLHILIATIFICSLNIINHWNLLLVKTSVGSDSLPYSTMINQRGFTVIREPMLAIYSPLHPSIHPHHHPHHHPHSSLNILVPQRQPPTAFYLLFLRQSYQCLFLFRPFLLRHTKFPAHKSHHMHITILIRKTEERFQVYASQLFEHYLCFG